MPDRLTVDEFFEAMRKQKVYPLLDTPHVRDIVEKSVRALCHGYPIQDRWPVLDLEGAYEGYLNAQPEVLEWHRGGYSGTISAGSFDDKYELDEWFDDFRIQWQLKDSPAVRKHMLLRLPPQSKWRSPDLYAAYKAAAFATTKGIFNWLFGRSY